SVEAGGEFRLRIQPAADRPGVYELREARDGTVEAQFRPRPEVDFDPDPLLVEVRRDPSNARRLEGRVDWREMLRTGGRPAPGETWRIALGDGAWQAVKFEGPTPATSRPHGISRFVPVTTSTVVGSPEPPPPYQKVRLFPKLKINYPICVKPQPGTDLMLVIDQVYSYGPTRIGRIRDHPDCNQIETLLDSKDTAYDICFHPNFAQNGYVYIGSNGDHPSGKKHSRVTRYVMERQPPYRLDAASATVIIEWPSDGHNGAAICFGKDGMLYVTSGDGTADSDTDNVGQEMTTLLAKVLRIDVDRPDPGRHYSIPKDNPFIHLPDARPETWAFGLRNPWRITCDEKTGHIWVGQNGQDLYEQAFLVRKGDNYGWSVMEGSHPFYRHRQVGPAPIVPPTIEHHHSEFRSLTGGVVYHGSRFPDLQGAYIYGDYSTGKIWGMKHDGTKPVWHRELCDSHLQITWIGLDTRGELIIADHRGNDQGGFYSLTPTPPNVKSTFPRKLSESGLFESVAGHVMKPGVIPYSVNAPFWSDGAHKQRWMMLPGESPRIDYTANRGWNLPDRTVLIKSFALDFPQGRRWIETRFLTKQDGEWYGYSYEWNDDQTDAVLVDRAGKDREFQLGNRKQTWRYPSRAECMVCHSRAANFVLGLSTLQFNTEHDYGGGVVDNQLRVLEHLGWLTWNPYDEMRADLRESARTRFSDEAKLNEYLARVSHRGDQRAPITSSTMLPRSPNRFPRLVNPYDPKEDLDRRARSFLHANCSMCHVEAGGGNAQMDLEFTTPAERMRIFNVRPLHDTFGLPEARLIAPGEPARSVLWHRIAHRERGHMPPVATFAVDRDAVQLLHDWIARMNR
ncbi:MAG: PQQ-dependent sugar dehydrogenase, partial [Gemmataceae bacterium]|nr:PQQ-dependent sugar dehydrogenase [Gemmataceae bacterium]